MISYCLLQCSIFTLSLAALVSLSLLISPVIGSEAFCDSLISYNQYSILLKDAPRCFRDGCGEARLESLSSGCDISAPCSPLWRLINEQHQSYHSWCDYCHDNRACRIPGWPVLNVLAVCDSVSLRDLGNASTQCCSSIAEKAELRDWIGTLCDGSWNYQFSCYDGQARRDWEEWILPWNWTTVLYHLDSQPIFQPLPLDWNWTTPSSDTWLEYRDSPPYLKLLQLFAIENVAFAASFLFVGLVLATSFPVWHRIEKSRGLANKMSGNAFPAPLSRGTAYWSSLLLPAILIGMESASNFVSAYIVQRSPDYQSVSVSHLALLFSTRPRLAWIFLAQFVFPDRFLARFFGLYISKRFIGTSQIQESFKTATFSMLVAEFVDQLAGRHLLATTVSKIGVEKRFYLPGRLLPYAWGRSAALVYFSAFIWLSAEFSLVMTLTVLAYYQRRTIIKSLRQLRSRFSSRTSESGKNKGFAEYHRPIKLVAPSVQRGLKQSDLTSDSVSSIRHGCQSAEKEQEKVNALGIIHDQSGCNAESDGKGYIGFLSLTLLVVNLQLYCAQWAFWAGWISLLGERLDLLRPSFKSP